MKSIDYEILKIKLEAFDAMLKVSHASDPYYKKSDALFGILHEAGELIREARDNG